MEQIEPPLLVLPENRTLTGYFQPLNGDLSGFRNVKGVYCSQSAISLEQYQEHTSTERSFERALFDTIFMCFELTDDEITEINLLHNEFEIELARRHIITALNEEYSQLFSDMAKKVSAIRKKARERALKYYASHVDELITALQGEAKYCACEMCRLEELEQDDHVPQSIDYWKEGATEAISIYSGLLSPEAQSDLLNFVDYAFNNREQIFKDEEEKEAQRQETPAVRTITRRSIDLKLETTRVGRIIFEREEKSGFSNEAFYNCTNDNMPEVFTGTHPKNRRKEILTFVSLQIENLKQEVPAIDRLEPFDGEVLSSSISLYAVGNEYTSPDAIYRHMLGNKRGAKLHPQMREAILASLRKLRLTSIIIRAEQELEAGYSKKSRYEGVILPNEVIEDETVSLNGENVRDCIHFFRNSPLYDYADDKNQISRIPVAMLDVPADNDKEFIILKGYLTRRYAEARNSNSKLRNIIRYDSLFAYMGIDSGNRKHTKRIRDKVKLILETWKKAGYITGYEELKEGRTIAKIKIKLPRKKFHTE